MITQIRAANANMRKGRNTLPTGRAEDASVARYLGQDQRQAQHQARRAATCGNSTLEHRRLRQPARRTARLDLLLVGRQRRMGRGDIILDNGAQLVDQPAESCSDKWDFEGTVTHECGHAYGIAHTGNGHSNLTMQPASPPARRTPAPWASATGLGMNKMYGHRWSPCGSPHDLAAAFSALMIMLLSHSS